MDEGSGIDSFLREVASAPEVSLHYASLVQTTRRPPVEGAHVEPPIVPRDAYVIQSEHARGGMGRVLWAYDRRLGRTVAIKELLRRTSWATALFIHEATVTARLQHPAIVPVHEVGRWPEGGYFYAMKMVAGRPLQELIREGTTLAARMSLLPSVLTVADAIAYAHSEGVIHRDLKPGNIILGSFGETVVIDWGLARRMDEKDHAAEILGPAIVGTPAFMAPEQASGGPVDGRADVYAIGSILYALLSGAAPYAPSGSDETLRALRAGPPPPLRRTAGIPPDLLAIVDKAMAREPAARYATAQELAADLRRFLDGQLVPAYRYPALTLLRRWLARHRAVVAVSALALCAVAVIGALGVRRVVRERIRAEAQRALAEEERGRRTLMLAQQPGHEAEALTQAILAAGPALQRGGAPLPQGARALRAAVAAARQVRPLSGHVGPVRSVAFSPDGAQLLSASADGTARLWEPGSGRPIAALRGLAPELRWAGFSPDGARIAIAGAGGPAQLLLRDGRPARTLGGGPSAYHTGAFSPDGHRLLLLGGEARQAGRRIELWDVEAGALVAAMEERTDISTAAFSSDGRLLLSATAYDGVVHLWDGRDGRLLRTILAHPDGVHGAALSPDGGRVLTTAMFHGALRLWDGRDGRLLREAHIRAGAGLLAAFSPDGTRAVVALSLHDLVLWDAGLRLPVAVLPGHHGEVWRLAFSPSGDRFVTAARDGTARIWDTRTGQALATLAGHDGRVSDVAFSPDERFLATAGDDHAVRVYSGESGTRSAMLRGHESPVRAGTWSADGARVITVDGGGGVRFWDGRTGRLLSAAPAEGDRLDAVAASPDGRFAVAAARDGTVRLFDLRAQLLVRALRPPGPPPRRGVVAISPDGERYASAGARDAFLWSTRTDALLAVLRGHRGYVENLCFSADGGAILISGQDGTARLFDGRTGAPGPVLRGHGAMVNEAVLSPDGRLIATASDDRTARLFLAATGAPLATLGPHEDEVWHVAFTPDGAQLASTGAEPLVRVWDVRDPRHPTLLQVLRGHTEPVRALAYAPDGTRLLTAGEDHTARLWDRAGRPLATLRGHEGLIYFAAFSPDGERVLTGSSDRTARLWDGRTGQPLANPGSGLLLPVGQPPDDGEEPRLEDLRGLLAEACLLLSHRPEAAQVRPVCGSAQPRR